MIDMSHHLTNQFHTAFIYTEFYKINVIKGTLKLLRQTKKNNNNKMKSFKPMVNYKSFESNLKSLHDIESEVQRN